LGSEALPAMPRTWSVDAERVLALRGDEGLPLSHPDDRFDLVHAGSRFARVIGGWADLLLELHRVAGPDGLVVAALTGPGRYEALTGETWDEDRIGMNLVWQREPPAPGADAVVDWESAARGAAVVVHSEWWIRAHWGRAFEVVEVEREPDLAGQGATDPELAGHAWVLLRKRPAEPASEELERPEPGEPREVLALRHNVIQLQAQLQELSDQADAARRAELNALRESFRAELERKSVQVARAQKATEQAVHNFKSTLSWRVTRPLRALRRAYLSLRRS
jgi:SAM-dependent methyltransferase